MSSIERTGSGLLVVMMDSDPAHDDDFNRWYNEEHVPERLSCPGFLGARRFVAQAGTEPRFLALYQLESPKAVETNEYLHALNNPTPWTKRTHEYRIKTVRGVYEEVPID
jgi:hypothetical protein